MPEIKGSRLKNVGKKLIFNAEDGSMDVRLNDIIEMKKAHPCGMDNSSRFTVLRIGMDCRLRCCGCGHEFMIPRRKAEKNIRKIIREQQF